MVSLTVWVNSFVTNISFHTVLELLWRNSIGSARQECQCALEESICIRICGDISIRAYMTFYSSKRFLHFHRNSNKKNKFLFQAHLRRTMLKNITNIPETLCQFRIICFHISMAWVLSILVGLGIFKFSIPIPGTVRTSFCSDGKIQSINRTNRNRKCTSNKCIFW